MPNLLDALDGLQHLLLRASGFRSRFVETRAGRMHSYVAEGSGTGPPVVLIHGISANALHWTRVAPFLRRHSRRVILPELPGHGSSEVPAVGMDPDALTPAVVEHLDALVDEPALLVGNSLGGAAALRYALARRERVRGLLLASPGGAGDDEAGLRAFLDRFSMPGRAEAVRFLDRLYGRRVWYAPLLAGGVRARFLDARIQGLIAGLQPQHLFRAEDLADLRVPVVLCWGRLDALMLRSHFGFFRDALPGHTRVEETGHGHCPQLDDPLRFTRRILRFIRETTDGADATATP